MAITGRQEVREALGFSRNYCSRTLDIVVATCCVLATGTALAGGNGRFCSATAQAQLVACKHEVKDNSLTQKAICINIPADAERKACLDGAKATREEELHLCKDKRDARRAICDAIGEERYAPDFNPDDFDTDFANPPHPNLYFPLKIGDMWEFAAPAVNETNTVEILPNTKLIEGVTCIVQRDLVKLNGEAKEFTDDWLAQANNGDVVYCGEEVKDYERFPGDNPPEPELVAIDGSFKVGRNGDKPGVFFFGSPPLGTTYRQEYSIGNAEDVATVVSVSYGFGNDPVLDEHVPQALADHLCDNDCVVTLESQPSKPGVSARKYYAPNIGVFLEIEVESGEVNRLIGCNVDPKCATLPAP